MKKVIIVALLLIVSLFFTNLTFAQDVASQSSQINYQLPYPGILPDNPLYFFKVLRDKIEEFLISDSQEKAKFDLLSADKRLSMGIALSDKKEYSLSETTISKGENYFEDGIRNIERVEKEGRAVDPSILVSYDLSSKKHKEVIGGLVKETKGNLQKKFQEDLQRISGFIDSVSKLRQ